MIYLDNCSTTHQKPKCVLKAIKKGLTRYNYNAGRGGYNNAILANLKVLELRDSATIFFGAENSSNVIITKSCTEAINIAIRSSIKPNGHIISTIFEHNSVLRTLDHLSKEHNITYTLLSPNNDGLVSIKDIINNIRENTYMIIVNHISNVTGFKQNITEIGEICKKHNLIFVVDGAQSAGHTNINMREMNINYLSIAGHKGVLGPQGIGLLVCNNTKPAPLIFGGTGTFSESISQPIDIPEGIESGTMSIANIMGLNAGIKYVSKNFKKIENKIQKLTNYLIK
ncbi:MAG: aminotransferase class V-fold PLP-dependent enzyme [Clostridiales bacterium]|nr:aminotransferase class V-fold PLP-dependent enzyme [Clostridiales bacterium]